MFSVLITREMTMGKIMHKYCKVKNLEKLGFRFMLDGLRVVDTDTAGSVSTIRADSWSYMKLTMTPVGYGRR